MELSKILILVVDDYEPWRDRIRSILKLEGGLQVVDEASDGLEAVRKAVELKPDLILLDIGLPKLSGIEAARQIRIHAPQAKILFISQERSWDIAEEALRTGAGGYVVKSNSRTELVPAIRAVLEGKKFISARFGSQNLVETSDEQKQHARHEKGNVPLATEHRLNRHEVAFYPDDLSLVAGFANFIEASLRAGAGVIALLNESHSPAVLDKLQANGIDPYSAIDEGRLALCDVADTLRKMMVNDQPDPVRCSYFVADLVKRVNKDAYGEPRHVVACGECAPTLLEEGKTSAAIRLECLWDEVSKIYDLYVLCGYCWAHSSELRSGPIFDKICAEHSSIHPG